MTWPVALFVAVYLVASAFLCVYGTHAFLMTWLYHRRRRPAPVPSLPRDLPRVTVQLPVYNELYVVRRLVDAVCAFDYPADRLQIQVLDDSTDETVGAVSRLVAGKRRQGHRIEQVRRTNRSGFKGGALRDGLERADGELIAIFDADFVPPPDFLARTVPFFGNATVGMVQTRWGHLNGDYSLLTQVQAMALDGHFLIEQTARNRNGAFINFNGTAGIWRRRAIEDAGNWQDDTLTEDLDLSYRAQMNGWRFVFLPDVVCPAELPAEVNGFKGQQFRWAKGSVQTAVKLLPRLLAGRPGWFRSFQATIHLTNHAVYPLLFLVALLSLPALVVHARVPESRLPFSWATAFILGSLGHPVLYLYSQARLGRGWLKHARLVPVLIALGMGIAVNNTRAMVQALGGIPSGFNRTPKYDLLRPTDGWRDKKYRVPRSPGVPAELFLGAYLAVSTVYSALHAQYLVTPFLALYAGGLLYIGGLSVRHASVRPAPRDSALAA